MMVKLNGMAQNPIKLIILATLLIIGFIAFMMLRKKFSNLLKGKLGGIIAGFVKGISSIKDMENKFQFIILSLLIWACYFYSLYVCFFAFSATAHLTHSVCIALLLFGTFGVIFTPGGLGVYPAIISSLLVFYGIDQISAFAFPWLTWTLQFLLILVLGLLSLILLPIINKSKENVIS